MVNKVYSIQAKSKYINHLLCFFLSFYIFSFLLSCKSDKLNSQISKPTPITFNSEGSKLNGFFYPAKTNKPAPTAILLHGDVGNDKEPLGLGTRMMKEGINALAFNYRGTWGNEGFYTPENSLQDVKSAVSFILSPKTINNFSIDTTQLFLVGYSYGGTMALIGSLNNPSIKGVISIVGLDLSVLAREMKKSESFRSYIENYLEEIMSSSGAKWPGGKALVEEMLSTMMVKFDLVLHANELAQKNILLLGGWHDKGTPLESYILPLYRALEKNKAESLEIEMFNDNHSFENRDERERLINKIISWIKN